MRLPWISYHDLPTSRALLLACLLHYFRVRFSINTYIDILHFLLSIRTTKASLSVLLMCWLDLKTVTLWFLSNVTDTVIHTSLKKENIEFMTFCCVYCNGLNSAHKSRPIAARLSVLPLILTEESHFNGSTQEEKKFNTMNSNNNNDSNLEMNASLSFVS